MVVRSSEQSKSTRTRFGSGWRSGSGSGFAFGLDVGLRRCLGPTIGSASWPESRARTLEDASYQGKSLSRGLRPMPPYTRYLV